MARSAHAYVRGTTSEFYVWLRQRRGRLIPAGPPVWICGDCHAGNIGPIASAKGDVDVQIRDLDQTVIGNPAHDLVRLALSLATAARGSDLPGVTTARMLEQMMEGYEQALSRRSSGSANWTPEPVRAVLKQAWDRSWKHLAKERLEDARPTIPLGDRFWPLSRVEKMELKALFHSDEVRHLVTSLKSRKQGARIEVLDAAYWIKGCSSLGRLRYAVLLGIGKGSKKDDFCLIDIKEAVPAAAPRSRNRSMPRDNAKRVVQGARHLAPYLGERMLPAKLLGRSVFLRELTPQDLKLEIDQLTCEEAVHAARFLAHVIGTAHARQMTVSARQEWCATLHRNRSTQLDAPSWLWSSIVDLIARHEAAYLEHCRTYAMGK